MFYEPHKNNHGLPHNPFKSLIVPRPIGWISSQDSAGNVNLAPYSYFNAVCDEPAMIMFSTTNRLDNGNIKDTLHNVETQGEFVVNMATYPLRAEVNLSSASLPHDENEFAFAKLEMLPSILVKPPRVKNSPIHLECVYHQSVQLPTVKPEDTNRIVIGKIIGIHIDDQVIVDGLVDFLKVQPIGRLGYHAYNVVDSLFDMKRPR